jgi:hypothetical protein
MEKSEKKGRRFKKIMWHYIFQNTCPLRLQNYALEGLPLKPL